MRAFKFDAYAELAKIRSQNPTPATVATPATVGPNSLPQVETVASVAGIAEARGENENRSCPITDLFERIGIMCENGGQDAYDAAARDQGYQSFDDAISQALKVWAGHLRNSVLPCVADARANWHHVEIAARHGWGEIELFGRYSGLIVRLEGDVIRHIHQSYATTTYGAIYPRASRPGEWPVWEEGQ